MAETHTYAVYFHPQALEVLGEAIKPYLTEGPAGQYLLCKEIDTGGSFCELTLVGAGSNAKASDIEVMVPSSMIRLVVSVGENETDFGFG